jgi:hypothetical protein
VNETRLKILSGVLLVIVVVLGLDKAGVFEPDLSSPGANTPFAPPQAVQRADLSALTLHELTGVLPTTPAGERMAWGLGNLNVRGLGLTDTTVVESIAASVLETTPAPEFIADLTRLSEQGPFAFVGHISAPMPNFIHGAVTNGSGQVTAVILETEPIAPHRIVRFVVLESIDAPFDAPSAVPPTMQEPAVPAEAPAAGSAAPAEASAPTEAAAPAEGSAPAAITP